MSYLTTPASTIINEILSTHYSYEHKGIGDKHNYTFSTDKGNKYRVDVDHKEDYLHDKPYAEISFEDQDKRQDITGREGRSAHKVLSTVVHIIKHHADKHSRIDPYEFNADDDHIKTYRAIAKKLANKHQEFMDDPELSRYTTLSVNRSDIK